MKLNAVEFEGKGVRMGVPKDATMDQLMLASRPRTMFRVQDGDDIRYDPTTHLVVVTNSGGQVRAIHASRAAWMDPDPTDLALLELAAEIAQPKELKELRNADA